MAVIQRNSFHAARPTSLVGFGHKQIERNMSPYETSEKSTTSVNEMMAELKLAEKLQSSEYENKPWDFRMMKLLAFGSLILLTVFFSLLLSSFSEKLILSW
eukprot:scaffold3834_cov179-Ochromonas_danica.AAC.7